MKPHDATKRDSDLACVAGVLVGGSSQRMGRPKSLLPHAHSGTFVEHVVSTARHVVPEVVLLGADADLPASLDEFRLLPDECVGGGPLAGLCAAFSAIHEGWILMLACDLPMIEPALLENLLRNRAANLDAVAYARNRDASADLRHAPSYHACCALFHSRIQPRAMAELALGSGSIQRVLRSVRLEMLVPTPSESRQLANVNTPEDLERLNDFWAASDGIHARETRDQCKHRRKVKNVDE